AIGLGVGGGPHGYDSTRPGLVVDDQRLAQLFGERLAARAPPIPACASYCRHPTRETPWARSPRCPGLAARWAQLLSPQDRQAGLAQLRLAILSGRRTAFECRLSAGAAPARWCLLA